MYTFAESKEELEFITFLVKNGVYTIYMRNLAYAPYKTYSWTKFKRKHNKDWIDNAFVWGQSDYPSKIERYQKTDFWHDLSVKWQKRPDPEGRKYLISVMIQSVKVDDDDNIIDGHEVYYSEADNLINSLEEAKEIAANMLGAI